MEKTDAKAKKPEPASAKSSAAADGAAPSSGAADSPAPSSAEGEGVKTKKKKDPPRPASFFSSVRTDEYRSGWDSVFGKAKTPSRRRKGPHIVELSLADLTEEERAALLGAAKRKARGRRVNLDRAAKNGELDWTIVCRIGRDETA